METISTKNNPCRTCLLFPLCKNKLSIQRDESPRLSYVDIYKLFKECERFRSYLVINYGEFAYLKISAIELIFKIDQ